MKRFPFFPTLMVAASLFLIISCNSGEDKTTTVATDSSSVKQDTQTLAKPAAEGPKMVLTITHKVANFAKWKPGYESHDSVRLAHGLHNYVIARGVDDSNMVMVALRMDDTAKAKELVMSAGIKERMKKSGVVGPPSVDYLNAVMNDTTGLQQTVRLMVKTKVKDYDAWKTNFDSDIQARMEAGLTDRVISYSVSDKNKITIVFGVTDLAKARAFMKSERLKTKMKEAGVMGAPTMFFYKVVARY